MSQVASTDELVTKTDLATFYQGILPYLGGMPEMVANKFTKSDLYSTDEKIIGQWTDGKPLYQKCYSCTTPSSTSGYNTIITLDSTIEPKKLDGWLVKNNVPINCYASSSYRIITQYTAATHVIEQQVKGHTSQPEIVVLQYTKTTDSAISIGNETDYSTDEKIIGTWVDGKPIYQKTVDCGALPNNTTKSVAHGISNIDAIIEIRGSAYNDNHNGFSIPLADNNNNYSVFVDKDGDYIRIGTAADRSSLNHSYVTLQYTKTTD